MKTSLSQIKARINHLAKQQTKQLQDADAVVRPIVHNIAVQHLGNACAEYYAAIWPSKATPTTYFVADQQVSESTFDRVFSSLLAEHKAQGDDQ